MKKLLLLISIFLLAFTPKYTPDLNNFLQPIKCDKVLQKTFAPNTNIGMSKAKLKEYRATLEEIKRVCNF